MTHYAALIRKEIGSDFGVEFPDFPGCVAAGNTLDEFLLKGIDAEAAQHGMSRSAFLAEAARARIPDETTRISRHGRRAARTS